MTDTPNNPSPRPPSPWIARFAPLIAEGGAVLDVACGTGRHAVFFAGRGHPVTALDRDVSRVPDLPGIETVEADLEDGSPWPLPGRSFAGIVVTNYLYRPLFPALVDALAPGGALLYETFAIGNERYGKPRNPDFLLEEGELLELLGGRLRVVAYECGFVERPAPAVVQHIAAVKPAAAAAGPLPIPPPA